MLRTRVRRQFGAGVLTVTITHGLGFAPDYYHRTHISARGGCRSFFGLAELAGTNRIVLRSTVNSQATVDVFCIVYQGRLY